MIHPQDTIIMGISGGADSVCLLHILYTLKHELKLNLRGVHVHHGLRQQEADEDAAFVQELCEKMGIPVTLYSFEIKKEAHQRKVSEEEAGRLIRYEVFEKERSKFKQGKIAVGHHMNDQAETILFNLMRGSGLKGIGGMAPVRGHILRPLLAVTREEIETYCKDRNLSFRTDSTNLVELYSRNKIRLNLIPYMEEQFNPELVKSLYQFSRIIKRIDHYMEEENGKAMERCVTMRGKQGIIHLESFLQQHPAIQYEILRKILNSILENLENIGYKHFENIIGLVDKQSGKKVHLPQGILVKREYDHIIIEKENRGKAETEPFCCKINPPCILEIPGEGGFVECRLYQAQKQKTYSKKTYTKCFDYDKIKGTLEIRTKRPGDFIFLRGINGKKKIKSFFIDQKVPRTQRGKIPLLAEGQNILWIVGYRINERYKIDSSTKNILEITYRQQ